jgi:hypothetical protein
LTIITHPWRSAPAPTKLPPCATLSIRPTSAAAGQPYYQPAWCVSLPAARMHLGPRVAAATIRRAVRRTRSRSRLAVSSSNSASKCGAGVVSSTIISSSGCATKFQGKLKTDVRRIHGGNAPESCGASAPKAICSPRYCRAASRWHTPVS